MKFKLLLSLAFLGIFVSCQKEFLDPSTSGTVTTPAPGGSGGGSLSTCKNCIYIPTCDGSVYNYNDTSAGIPGTPPTATPFNYTLRFVADTTIGGLVYQKMRLEGQTTNNTFTYYNCNAGVSTSINYNAVTTGGSTYSQIKLTALKANDPVGTTWSDQIVQSPTQTALLDYTIVAKGISRTVAGINYPDVIQVNYITSASVGGIVIPAGNSTNYFAKGVGLIESVSYIDFLGSPIQSLRRVLISSVIP